MIPDEETCGLAFGQPRIAELVHEVIEQRGCGFASEHGLQPSGPMLSDETAGARYDGRLQR